jgi:hypothetical protein
MGSNRYSDSVNSRKRVAEGLVNDVGVEVTKQSWENCVEMLVGIDHFAFRIPAAGSKVRKDPEKV